MAASRDGWPFDAGGLYPRPREMRRAPVDEVDGRPASPPNVPPRAACSGLTHHFLATMELAEELLHRSRQSIVVQTINYVLTLALVDDQVRLFEDRQVAGDGGLGK